MGLEHPGERAVTEKIWFYKNMKITYDSRSYSLPAGETEVHLYIVPSFSSSA